MEYHRLSNLNIHISKVLEADLVSGETPLPSLQLAVFLLYPHVAETVRASSRVSYKSTIPIHEGSSLMT